MTLTVVIAGVENEYIFDDEPTLVVTDTEYQFYEPDSTLVIVLTKGAFDAWALTEDED